MDIQAFIASKIMGLKQAHLDRLENEIKVFMLMGFTTDELVYIIPPVPHYPSEEYIAPRIIVENLQGRQVVDRHRRFSSP